MKTMFFLCLWMFVAMVPVHVMAQETLPEKEKTAFTLEEAVNYAVNFSYSVQTSAIDLEIAKKKIWETTAIGLPQVSGTLSYQHIFTVPEMSFPATVLTENRTPSTYSGVAVGADSVFLSMTEGSKIELGAANSTTLDFTVSQLIFSGEYIVGLRASKVFREMSEQNLAKSKLDIRESVTRSYYLVLVMEENLRILKETQQITDKNMADIVALNEQGLVESTGVDQLRIIKANVDNTVANIERGARITKSLLKFQMGIPVEREISLSDKLEQTFDEAGFNTYLQTAFDPTTTIDFKIVETAEKLQKLSYDRQKTTFLPSVAAYYRHQKLFNAPEFNFQPADVVGLSVNIPIFSSGMRVSQTQQAKMELNKMQLAKLQATEGLQIQYQTNINDFQTAYSDYLTNKQNLELSKKIFDQTMIKYKEGMASTTDLHQTETQYLQTQGSYFTALNNLLGAKTRLDKLFSKI